VLHDSYLTDAADGLWLPAYPLDLEIRDELACLYRCDVRWRAAAGRRM
jgi:hypothetical protein